MIARLNNCALLNFRAFRIFCGKKIAVVALSHIIQHTQDTAIYSIILTRMRITRNSLWLIFCEDWW